VSEKNNELFACIIETEQILDDLMTLNYEIQEAAYEMNTSSDEVIYKIADRRKDILFEGIVIKLYKLFEVHSILGKCIIELGKQQTLSLLKPFWKLIISHEKMISNWRNEIVAHSSQRAKDFKLYNEIDSNYFTNIQIILKVSRYAVIYLWALRGNLYHEYIDAWKKKDEKMLSIQRFDINDLFTTIIHSEKDFFKKINDVLEQNNLQKGIFCGYHKWPMEKTD